MSTTTDWHLRIRRDTSTQWNYKNPILLLDEVGLETDTRKFKIGNGVTPWALLPYGTVSGPNSTLVFISTDAENAMYYGADGGLYVKEEKSNAVARYNLAKL